MALVGRLAPPGTRRRALTVRCLRQVNALTAYLERYVSENPVTREHLSLKRSWRGHAAEDLDEYLVSGYQNPRINAQSILARHFLIEKVLGSQFEELKREELEFCVETNAAVRKRAAELGVELGVHIDQEKRAAVAQVCEVIAEEQHTFEERWANVLSEVDAGSISVLELACGSANDYRFFDSYGIARFLDYTGVDLNETNVANARRRYPGVRFENESILELPYADNSVDYVVAFDIFEHLSLAAMEQSMAEALRVARYGIIIAFFIMVDAPEHNERPKGTYYWNELSKTKIEQLLGEQFGSVRSYHIPTYLRENYGARRSYNKKAWTVIAEKE